MNLIAFILACYGMTMILVYGKILQPFRPSNHFFHCAMCMGFWVGLFIWLITDIDLDWFIAGCISSGTSYFLSRLVDDDGILIKLKNHI